MIARRLLIGVDVGSTHVKAALVRPGTGVTHVARRDTPIHAIAGGGAYHGPGELLAAVESVILECAEAATGAGGVVAGAGTVGGIGTVAGIGVASMAEAGAPLDHDGRPLGEILAWFDPRPAAQTADIEAAFTPEGVFARTGLRVEPKYTLPKLLWWRAEKPAEYAKLWRWAGVAELVAFDLTGSLATNASLATRTLAFDPIARRWDRELLGLAGVTDEQLPEVLPLGVEAGRLLPDAASRLALPAGIPVAVAGHDHVIAGLGSGVAHAGDALDSMGSAEVALLVTAVPLPTDAVRLHGFSTGAHAVDGLGYVLGGLQSAGSMLEWFVERFMPAASRSDRYAALAELLAAVPAPADVLAKPYPRGRTAPYPDRDATLEILGLRDRHTKADLAAALVDAAAFHVRWMFDELAAVAETRLGTIRVTGGGTRNPRWLAAKNALAQGPLALVRTDEAAALGAALVAGIAAGEYADLEAALADAAPAEILEPAEPDGERYRRAYLERWLPLILAGVTKNGPRGRADRAEEHA